MTKQAAADAIEKRKLIAQMIQLQKKFIAEQRRAGVSAERYYAPSDEDALAGHQQRFDELATRLVDLAHRERGTSR